MKKFILLLSLVSTFSFAQQSKIDEKVNSFKTPEEKLEFEKNWTPEMSKVYVDKETRFAYINTPYGWKFIKQIEQEKIKDVPSDFFVRIDQRK